MRWNKKWMIAPVAGLALVAGASVAAVSGQEPVAGTSFIDRVAAKLGIESADLEDAVDSVAAEDVDARVASGDLTEEQAAEIKERIESTEGFGFGPGIGGHHRGGFPLGDADALTEFFGVEADALFEELKAEGATLATVAEAHGKSREELKAYLIEQSTTRINESVAEGRLTQAEADEKLADIEANIDERIDSGFPALRGGPGGGPGFGADGGMRPGLPFDHMTDPALEPSATPAT